MRAVLFVTVLSLICLNAVQANRISKSAHTSTQRSKHTLQRNTLPKLSAVTASFTEDFTVRVTFANCLKDSTLTVDDFTFDANYETSNLALKTIVTGIQFELTGKAVPLKDSKVTTGGPFAVSLNGGSVTFPNIITGQGVSNERAQTTLTYMKAADFKSITTAISKSAEDPYVGFVVTFGSKCAPAAMKGSSQTLYDKFFKVSSASGKGKIFSVQPLFSSGSTCRPDIGMSDNNCPDTEVEIEFQVWTTSSAPEDVITLRTKKGLCRSAAGGISFGSTDTGFIQQGADSCGPWSAFSSCGDGCFDVDGFSTSSTSEQCRTREPLSSGFKCKVTTECRPCRAKPCDMFAARPRSGETRTECFGCNTNNNYIGWTAPSGCKCGDGCEETGDCCQSWFHYGCQAKKYKKAEYLKEWAPRQCSSTTCLSAEPVIDNEFPSYFCYCSSNCAANNVDLCCDGKTNRDTQCAAAAPGRAPGSAPGR